MVSSNCMLFADITLEEGGKYVRVRLSGEGKEMAFKIIEAIQDQALQIKTKIEVARGFMDKRAIHLTAYESFLDRIEGELRESIRSAQGTLYREEDPDSRREMRVILPEPDDDFLKLIEALPDYDGLEIDEDAYRTEEGILLHDKD
jgi:stage V sporulation protein SpoVS